MDRRSFVVGSAATATAAWAIPHRFSHADGELFRHGVASGDPLTDRVVIWTRVSDADDGPVRVSWYVAEDRALTRVVRRGASRTDGTRDHTVNVDVAGLRPGRTYFYGFEARGQRSPVGRTRTAPAGAVERARFAIVSCSDYEFGHFHAYARIAERDDLDAVVHLGDYIYEHGRTFPDNPMGRTPRPTHETVTLGDYRTRYAQHRGDASLQRAHGNHPWIVVWDDHEFADNAWPGGAEAHDPSADGDWVARKAAAAKAWREWMPVRLPDPSDPLRIWRGFRFGDLADLAMLDTRMWGRSAPATDTGPFGRESTDPNRKLLGDDQFRWLTDRLDSARTTWRLVGNQVMMAPHTFAGALPPLPPEVTDVLGLRDGGAAEGNDNWNAYAAERARLLGFLREHQIDNTVVLSGDIHSSWGADLVNNPFDRDEYDPIDSSGSAGVEFVTTSVTAVNVGDAVPQPALIGINTAVACENPNVKHVNLGGHGYLLLDLDHDRARGEWWHVGEIRLSSATGETLAAAAEAEAGANHLRSVGPISASCSPQLPSVIP